MTSDEDRGHEEKTAIDIDENGDGDEEKGREKETFDHNPEDDENKNEENNLLIDNDSNEGSGKEDDEKENEERGREQENFDEYLNADEGGASSCRVIRDIWIWITAGDFYKVPLKDGEKETLFERTDTKFAKKVERNSILFGMLSRVIMLGLLIGTQSFVSILRPTSGTLENAEGRSSTIVYRNDTICKENYIFDGDFVIALTDLATVDVESSCPDEDGDRFAKRILYPYCGFFLLLVWFVMKVFVSHVEETAKQTGKLDEGTDFCFYNFFVSSYRIIGATIYKLMGLSLQIIIAPLAALNPLTAINFDNQQIGMSVVTTISFREPEFMYYIVLLSGFATVCAIVIGLIICEMVLELICPCLYGHWKYPIGKCAPKVGYYLLMLCLLLFTATVIPLKIIPTWAATVKKTKACVDNTDTENTNYDTCINGAKDAFLLFFQKDVFNFPSAWWPKGLSINLQAINTFQIISAMITAPSILMQFVQILALALDGVIYIYRLF